MSHNVRISIVEQRGRSSLLAFRISHFAFRVSLFAFRSSPESLSSRPSGGTYFFSTGVAEFLPDDAAQRGLQRLLNPANVLPKSIVDQALIVAAAGTVHLLPKPVKKIVIEPDRDSRLPLGTRTTAPRFAWLKSYSRFIAFGFAP